MLAFSSAQEVEPSKRIMSTKVISSFIQKVRDLAKGGRILPSRTKDAEFQLRFDAGHYNDLTKKLLVHLQVNSQAKSPVLKDWVKKNSTHGNLASEYFDIGADDKDAELARFLSVMQEKAKNNIRGESGKADEESNQGGTDKT